MWNIWGWESRWDHPGKGVFSFSRWAHALSAPRSWEKIVHIMWYLLRPHLLSVWFSLQVPALPCASPIHMTLWRAALSGIMHPHLWLGHIPNYHSFQNSQWDNSVCASRITKGAWIMRNKKSAQHVAPLKSSGWDLLFLVSSCLENRCLLVVSVLRSLPLGNIYPALCLLLQDTMLEETFS